NGCSVSDAINVAYNPLPVAALGPDQTLCAGQTLNLNVAQPGATYLWQDGSTNASFTVSSAGTYSVDVLLNGCSASDAITVTYNPVPVVDLGPDQTVCPGTNVTLDATLAGATYLWQYGFTGVTLTSDQPGNYSVQVTAGGCSASDAVTIAQFNLQT